MTPEVEALRAECADHYRRLVVATWVLAEAVRWRIAPDFVELGDRAGRELVQGALDALTDLRDYADATAMRFCRPVAPPEPLDWSWLDRHVEAVA